MRDHLLQIKAVPGVKGCAVLDIGRREMHPLLPATTSSDFVQSLADRLLRLSAQMQPGEQVEFRFDKQACLVRRLVRGVLFVQGKIGFDIETLNLTLRACASAIDRALKSAQSRRALSYDFTNPEYLEAILKVFSLCADHFKMHLGHTLVAKRMQKAKENVSSLFPVVNGLVVDQNGRIYPIKGRALELDSSANEAFARWLMGFLNLAMAGQPGMEPLDVREFTKSVAAPLDDSNFYQTLQAV
jgi:hypothetical protein